MDVRQSSPPAGIQRDGREVERAYDAMLADIISGVLPPGAKLNETELASRFGIKRGPLREAIRMLQGRDFVVRKPNAGARVVLHSPKEVLDIYETREALEGCAARLCARRMSEAEIETLRQTNAAARANPGGAPGRVHFHTLIVRGSRNEAIGRWLDDDFFQLLRLWQTNFPWLRHGGAESRADHERITEAIAMRDGEVAEILMRRHLERLRQVVLKNLSEAGYGEFD